MFRENRRTGSLDRTFLFLFGGSFTHVSVLRSPIGVSAVAFFACFLKNVAGEGVHVKE